MRSFDFIVEKYFPATADKWHLCLILTLIPATGPSFLMFTQLTFLPPDHHCRQPTTNSTPWSPMDVVNLSIPYKANPQLPPRIGQPFHPCTEYAIDALWPQIKENMTIAEAISLRDSIYPNLTVRKCSHGVAFLPETAVMSWSAGEDFQTVCDRKHYVSLINSVYMIGMLIGFFFCGPLADNFGRRPVILSTCVVTYLAGFAVAFSVNVYLFMLLRGVIGLCLNMCYIATTILLSESVTKDGRNLYTTLNSVYVNFVSRPVLILILFLIQDWRWSHITYCYTAVFVLAGFYAWTESPRWLVSKGRVDDGLTAVLTILKRNGRVLTADETAQLRHELDGMAGPSEKRQGTHMDEAEMDRLSDEGHREEKIITEDARSKSMSSGCRGEWIRLTNLLRLPVLRRRFLLVVSLFILESFIFYGIMFHAVRLDGNPYVIAILNGLIGVPANAFQFVIYRIFNRKWPVVALYSCATVGLGVAFVFVACGNRGVPVIVSSTVGLFFVQAASSMLQTRFPELFPTMYRSTVMGFACAVAKLGSISAMNVERLDELVWPALPELLFTVAALLFTIVSAFLPPGRGEME